MGCSQSTPDPQPAPAEIGLSEAPQAAKRQMTDSEEGPLSYAVPFGHVPYCPSLPDAMGPLMQFPIEWWYYAGWAHDQTNTNKFTILLCMDRKTSAADVSTVTYGIGSQDENYFSSYSSMCYLSSNSKPTPTSWSIQAVQEIDPGLWTRMTCSLISTPHATPLGLRGAMYKVELRVNATGVSVTLLLEDQLGLVMEGTGLPQSQSYEFSMPRLSIMEGSLTIPVSSSGELKTFQLGGGNIWLDRQTLGPHGLFGRQKLPSLFSVAKSRLSRIARSLHPPKEMYTGDWLAIVMNDGTAYMLAFFWPPKDDQWIVGSALNPPVPPLGKLGLKYPPLADWNTISPVQGIHVLDEKDFDLNILNPEDPSNSLHWTSPATKQTYCSAWVLTLEQKRYYIRVLVRGSEINDSPDTPGTAFFEGAATISDREKNGSEVGHCFVEQMGYTRPPGHIL